MIFPPCVISDFNMTRVYVATGSSEPNLPHTYKGHHYMYITLYTCSDAPCEYRPLDIRGERGGNRTHDNPIKSQATLNPGYQYRRSALQAILCIPVALETHQSMVV